MGSQRVGHNWETKQQGLNNSILTNVDSRGNMLNHSKSDPIRPSFLTVQMAKLRTLKEKAWPKATLRISSKKPGSLHTFFGSLYILPVKKSECRKNWCFWAMVLEKTLESPLDCKEIQPVHPEGDKSWVFIRRTDIEAETPILWPPHVKSWLIGKDPDAGRDWGQEEKGTTEDEMAGWHHLLDGHEFE